MAADLKDARGQASKRVCTGGETIESVVRVGLANPGEESLSDGLVPAPLAVTRLLRPN